MPQDFATYQFEAGKTYVVAVEPGSNAVRVAHHGEGQLDPQDRYGMLEFTGTVGSGPWRVFTDWETEAEVTINAHFIIEAAAVASN